MTEPSARVVAASISPQGKTLYSVQITAHRFILAEINTHRMLSRSYRSSRAVPVKRLLEEVRTNPATPVFWGANRPGMQAVEELTGNDLFWAKKHWKEAAGEAARYAESLAANGLHKQIANRVLEPFLWVHGIITATEWDNFFGLRLHEDAQPEFRALANAVWAAFKASTPSYLAPGQWHTPYFDPTDSFDLGSVLLESKRRLDAGISTSGDDTCRELSLIVSTARCARSSYNSFDTGKRSTIEEDLSTYVKLNIPGTEFYDPTKPIHASPAEHQATPDFWDITTGRGGEWRAPDLQGNLVGWRQYRKMLPGEAVAPLPEGYA